MTPDEIAQAKEVQFYAAGVTGWYSTRMEHDKSLLTLSAGGLGLLVTLLNTVGVSSAEGLVLYLAAMLSFLLCLGSILAIFKKNSAHLEAALKDCAPPLDPWLTKLDNTAIITFASGILLSSVIGISAAISSLSMKGVAMANDNKSQSGKAMAHDSLNGVSNLKAGNDFTKSFNAVDALRPSAPQGTASSTAEQPSTPTETTATTSPAASTPAAAPVPTPKGK